MDKCEYMSEIEDDELVIGDHKFISNCNAKYLGQIINNIGEAKEKSIIKKLGTIGTTLNIAASNLTKKDRIKVFKKYMKAKINHLLPLISLNGNLENIWKEIRRTIFYNVLFKDTMPKESGTLMGISYYSIIIKPLLKLLTDQYNNNSNDEYKEFLYEASKKAMHAWIKVEENNTPEIKELINEYIEGNKFIQIEEWENKIYLEALKRLFRNNNIPNKITKQIKMKTPNIINLLSNAPKHIIIDILRNIKNKKKSNDGKKIIFKIIMKYLLVNELTKENITQLKEPDYDDIQSIIEQKQLEDLNIFAKTLKIKRIIEEKGEELVVELIKYNSNKKNEEIKITEEINSIMESAKNNLLIKDKKVLNFIEKGIEKLESLLKYNNDDETKEKRKPGRPKKKCYDKNKKIDEYFNLEMDID